MDDVLKSKYEEAIWIAKALFQHRIITGTTGNISFLHNKKMYITKSGSCLGKLDMDSFAITDLCKIYYLINLAKNILCI